MSHYGQNSEAICTWVSAYSYPRPSSLALGSQEDTQAMASSQIPQLEKTECVEAEQGPDLLVKNPQNQLIFQAKMKYNGYYISHIQENQPYKARSTATPTGQVSAASVGTTHHHVP